MKKLLPILFLFLPFLANAQDFYFLLGIIHESKQGSITLDITNYTARTIKVHPKFSVLVDGDSLWLSDPNEVLAFVPNVTQRHTFTGNVDLSQFKEKYVSVLYTITPHYTIQNNEVVATKPIDAQYLRLELPLPVTWLSFGVKRDGLHNRLEWLTASEVNADRFEVERSYNGRNYAKVGEVRASGTTSIVSSYSFSDYSPEDKAAYYRLRQVDFDGKHEYSKTVYAGSGNGGEYLGFALEAGEVPVALKTYDITGRLLREYGVGNTVSLPLGYSALVLTTSKRQHSRQIFTTKQ